MLVIAKHLGISNDIALPQSVVPVITSPKDLAPSSLGKLADELMLLIHNACFCHITNLASKITVQCTVITTQISLGLKSYGQRTETEYFADRVKMCKLWSKWTQKQNLQMLLSSQHPIPTNNEAGN